MTDFWSHPFLAVWYDPPRSYPYVFRGPGLRERSFYLYEQGDGSAPSIQSHLERLGFSLKDVKRYNFAPPCIFCGHYLDTHVPGLFGENCRPKCHIEGCDLDACIQSIVSGKQPTCLHHFFDVR